MTRWAKVVLYIGTLICLSYLWYRVGKEVERRESSPVVIERYRIFFSNDGEIISFDTSTGTGVVLREGTLPSPPLKPQSQLPGQRNF